MKVVTRIINSKEFNYLWEFLMEGILKIHGNCKYPQYTLIFIPIKQGAAPHDAQIHNF